LSARATFCTLDALEPIERQPESKPSPSDAGRERKRKKVVSVRGEQPPRKKISWFYSLLPYNIALGPLGTFVQLYILHLYGVELGKIYVGLAVTAFNAVTIPASMIWGFATDRFHRRKPIIVISFFALGANLVAFLFVQDIIGIGVLYAIFALLSSASATPLNLLIMESEPKPRWASAFAKFSMVSSTGVTVGLLLSLGWVTFLPFEWLVVPLAILSLASGILALILIKEPSFVFERDMIVLQKRSFFERILQVPMIFLRIPRAADFWRIFKGMRHELTSSVPVLYISIFAFYIGSGVFNTSLVPALYSNSLSESQVFLVTLVANVVQIFGFRYVGPYIERRSLVKSAIAGLVVRSTCYSLFGISAFLVSGVLFIVPALIFYPIASGIAFAIYYTASNTMIFNSLGHRSQGSALGVYSALVGVATMIGSLISGFTSFYFGFYVTFMLAAFCLVCSALLTSSLRNLGGGGGRKSPAGL